MALRERQPAIKPSTTSPSTPGNGWTLPRAKRGSVIAANDDTSRANSAGTMDDGTADAGIAHLPHHLRPTSRLCKDPGYRLSAIGYQPFGERRTAGGGERR